MEDTKKNQNSHPNNKTLFFPRSLFAHSTPYHYICEIRIESNQQAFRVANCLPHGTMDGVID